MGTNLASVAEQELTAQQWFERCFNSKDRDEKLRFYSNALRLQPDFAEAFATEASRKAKGDLDGALADYDEAIRLKPDYGDAFHNGGAARYDKADLDGALADFDLTIQLHSSVTDAFFSRGVVRKAKGDSCRLRCSPPPQAGLRPGSQQPRTSAQSHRRAFKNLNSQPQTRIAERHKKAQRFNPAYAD